MSWSRKVHSNAVHIEEPESKGRLEKAQASMKKAEELGFEVHPNFKNELDRAIYLKAYH
jgi:hypothetical protein